MQRVEGLHKIKTSTFLMILDQRGAFVLTGKNSNDTVARIFRYVSNFFARAKQDFPVLRCIWNWARDRDKNTRRTFLRGHGITEVPRGTENRSDSAVDDVTFAREIRVASFKRVRGWSLGFARETTRVVDQR